MNLSYRRLPALIAVFVAGLLVSRSLADDKDKKEPPTKLRLSDRLAQRVTLDKYNGTFGEIIGLLSDKYGLPIVVAPTVGNNVEGAAAACDAQDDLPIKLPKLVNLRADTVLRLVCDQVNAMPLVKPDHIMIVPAVFGLYESGVLKEPDPANTQAEPPLLNVLEMQKSKPLIKRALVSATYKNVALEDILIDLGESTGATVILSPEVGEVAKKMLTARFANTPVDAAVRSLCEMADLDAIEDANVLVVTTHERAAARQKADYAKQKSLLIEIPGMGVGLGGGPVKAPINVVAELDELKKQNEQLRQQLNELKKQLKK